MFILFPMMFLTTIDVIGRAFWARPMKGTLEVSSYMLAVFVLAGMAYTQQAKGNVKVDFFLLKCPARLRHLLNAFTTLLCLLVVGVISWQGAQDAWAETTVSDMLRIPQWPFKMLVPVGGTLLALEFIFDFIDSIKNAIHTPS
jgi:TRAP-type C4-dicarboxylate transport system permease small subunit